MATLTAYLCVGCYEGDCLGLHPDIDYECVCCLGLTEPET